MNTLLLMFICSCYFIYKIRRGADAEKEFDIVIQMTLEHVLVQRFSFFGYLISGKSIFRFALT